MQHQYQCQTLQVKYAPPPPPPPYRQHSRPPPGPLEILPVRFSDQVDSGEGGGGGGGGGTERQLHI